METSTTVLADGRFELRFAAAAPGGHDYAFPCDVHGHVDLDTLPERLRCDYFFARALMGRDLAWPVVVPLDAAEVAALRRAA